jgi:hypothetical protein
LVVVTFNVATGIGNSTVSISFGDHPLARDISDPLAEELGASYVGGSVVLQGGGYEADLTPVPDGNGEVSVTDWIKVGRYSAGMDTNTMTPSQFQRADCAPRSTLGNGILSLTDWVQAGRYAAGLDPLTPAGGPTGPVGATAAKSAHELAQATGSGGREVRIPQLGLRAGQTNRVPVLLAAQGDESAVGFSLNFDPSVLAFVSGSGGTNAVSAVLNVNSTGASTGLVGLVLSLPIGTNTFHSGTQELAALRFAVVSNAIGSTVMSFADHPVLGEVSDQFANSLPASFTGGTLFVTPTLRITPAGTANVLAWPAWASNFAIEATQTLPAPLWTAPPVTASNLVNGEVRLTVPGSASQTFFRLRLP